ncbi:MAG: LPS export ABC transporter permease LptF [Pseudomonadota bacterium]
MLIYRYLSRQLFASTLAVAFVLVLVLVFGRFIKYLGDAAAGRIQAEVLFSLLMFRLPGFLELILPMSLFAGILLAFGRMYVDSEMTVLRAAGIGNLRLAAMCMVPALMMFAVVASFSTTLSPWGAARQQQVFEQQRARPEIDMLSAGRFYKRVAEGVERVTYAENLVENRTRLENVFLAEFPLNHPSAQPSVVTATTGHRVQDENGVQYLELTDGFRYEGQPGRADYHLVAFERYRLRVAENPVQPSEQIRSLSTPVLFERDDLQAVAERQWRISLPFMCLVAVLLAVPLSRVEPRQGRFRKLLPGILLFLIYMVLLIAARQSVEKGELSPAIGPWPVHLLFAGIGVALLFGDELQVRRAARDEPA